MYYTVVTFVTTEMFPLHPEEAQGNTTDFTARLARYATGNDARDYYRNNALPVETCFKVSSFKDLLLIFSTMGWQEVLCPIFSQTQTVCGPLEG
mgnify:CR=1 FL=1